MADRFMDVDFSATLGQDPAWVDQNQMKHVVVLHAVGAGFGVPRSVRQAGQQGAAELNHGQRVGHSMGATGLWFCFPRHYLLKKLLPDTIS